MKNAIGIDIGGTSLKGVLVTPEGNIIKGLSVQTPSKNFKETFFSVIRELLDGDIAGIGIGVAGILDRQTGVLLESPNIAELKNFSFLEVFSQEFALPVIVENDANTYTYAEKWLGAGREFDNFVLITVGTGIGGGVIYKGKLFEGAVEVGHMVIEPEGCLCSCGNVGCFESRASGRAIINNVYNLLKENKKSMLHECCHGNFYRITPELVYTTAMGGDIPARGIFRDMGKYLGIGVANLINIFSPQAVIIGGGLAGAWDLFIDELKRELPRRTLKPLFKNVQILRSQLGKDGGALGAAGLIFDKHG